MPLTASRRQQSKAFAALTGLSVVPALGIALFRLCDWAMFGGGLIEYDMGMKFASRTMQAATLIFILIIDRHLAYREQTLKRCSLVATCLSVVASATVLVGPWEVLPLVGCAVHGITGAVVMMGWGYYLCSVEPRRSAFDLTFAFALFGALTWVLSLLPSAAIAATTMVAIPLSYVCFASCLSRGATAEGRSDEPLTREKLHLIPWTTVAILLVCTLTSMFVHLLVPTTQIEFGEGYRVMWQALFVVVFLAYFVWLVVLGKSEPRRLWPMLLVIILGGLIGYMAFSRIAPGFAEDLLTSTQMLVMVFCWLVAADVIHTCRLPYVFSFTLLTLVFVEPITFVITLTGLFGAAAASPEYELLAVGVTAVMTLVLVVFTIALIGSEASRRKDGGEGNTEGSVETGGENAGALLRAKAPGTPDPAAAPAAPAPTDPLELAVAAIEAEYGLTQREGEVALCLARGYTLPQTAERQGVSIDTVRSHSKSLYRKLDIHKKQQLIELVEEYRREGR